MSDPRHWGSDLPLRAGDLIFTSIPNPLYRRVALATASHASHVGVAFPDPAYGWVVAESTFPFAKYSPLEKFVARSDGGWFTVRRLKGGLGPAQVEVLRRECDARMGTLYHLGFRYASSRQFCSKLAYDAYLAATGMRIGELESFSTLLQRRPQTQQTFWRFWFFGFIPWSRLTVTPASLIESDALETVLVHG